MYRAPLKLKLTAWMFESCINLMELSRADHVSRLLDQRLILTNQWVRIWKFSKHYWVTSQTMQILRRRPKKEYGDDQHFNEFNVQPQVVPHSFKIG